MSNDCFQLFVCFPVQQVLNSRFCPGFALVDSVLNSLFKDRKLLLRLGSCYLFACSVCNCGGSFATSRLPRNSPNEQGVPNTRDILGSHGGGSEAGADSRFSYCLAWWRNLAPRSRKTHQVDLAL